MALAKNGVNGAFSGKVGSIIAYELNGQNVMRSIGRRTKPYSELERLNQAKMKVVSEFLGPIKLYINFGFKREAPKGSRVGAFQLAQSYVRKNAVELDADHQPYINPANVLISKGPLAPPHNCVVERDGNRLTLRWDIVGGGLNDRLMVLLYDGDMLRIFREIGAKRKDNLDIWDVDTLKYADRPVHVYVAFRDTLFDKISDSVYCGTIE